MRMLDYDPSEKPAMTFQIFDADEDRIVAAAEKIEALKPDIIDLNMGCSVAGVSGRGAGAGLLRDPDKIGRIFNRLTKAVKVPVIATGRFNTPHAAEAALRNGEADAIGMTRAMICDPDLARKVSENRPDDIRAALPAIEREQPGAHAFVSAEPSEHWPVFVIWMGSGVQDRSGGA